MNPEPTLIIAGGLALSLSIIAVFVIAGLVGDYLDRKKYRRNLN